MLNCCLFGFGRAGKIHFKNIINSEINLKYIYDINVDKIKEDLLLNYNEKDIIVTSDLDEVLNDKSINLSIICTPTDNHYNLIISSLNNNRHVLCEKPLATSENEIIKCYSLARQKKLILLCAFNRRFDPQIINLKNNIKNIGTINTINTISRDYPYPTSSYLKISSGIFHDCGIHDIDYVNWLLNDKPISVFVTGNKIYNDNINCGHLDNAYIIMEYSNGIIANLNLSRISQTYDQRLEIHGTKGTLKKGDYKFDEAISFPEYYKDSYYNELVYFIESIKNNKYETNVTMMDCINTLNIANACDMSYKESKKIFIKYSNGFRNYNNVAYEIKENYRKARINQTVDFVDKMMLKYTKFDKKIKVSDIFEYLNSFVDISDPDITLPNIYHGYQTAESIKNNKYPEWLQLVGLIHDLGKIMFIKGCDEDGTSIKEQWAIVGDTFIVGCKLPDSLIFSEYNNENKDFNNNKYNTKLGIYKENCGLDNVKCSWGHDEYLYQILKYNNINLPEEAYYIIRYHSLYAYHDKNEYNYFMNEKDKKLKNWLKIFNNFDLYTKNDNFKINDELKIYYNNLINKYLNNGELWI